MYLTILAGLVQVFLAFRLFKASGEKVPWESKKPQRNRPRRRSDPIDSKWSRDPTCVRASSSRPLTASPIPIDSSSWRRPPKRAGWDGLFLWDHLLYDGDVTKILDPYISLAAIASATTTLQLGAMVTPLIRRRPQVVARQAVDARPALARSTDTRLRYRRRRRGRRALAGSARSIDAKVARPHAQRRPRRAHRSALGRERCITWANTSAPTTSPFCRRPRARAGSRSGSPRAGPTPRRFVAPHTTAASS